MAAPGVSTSPRAWWLPALTGGAAAEMSLETRSLRWSLVGECSAAGTAREIALGVLREWGLPHLAADVELVVSELVTNSLRHGTNPCAVAAGYETVIQLVMLRRADEIICAVGDENNRLPARREPDSLTESGRGLQLVTCFARSWGAVPTVPAGKYVWALFS